MPANLFRYGGDGEARCADCVIAVLEVNPGMRPSDWEDDDFGDTECDVCNVTVAPATETANDLMRRMAR